MELFDLKTLITVIEQGGITKAAHELNRVPSGVTNRILQLEASLGVQLFLREKKRLLLTPKGQELYCYAKKIMDLVTEAEGRVKSSEPGGRFRIGSMESTLASRLPGPLARLHARYRDVHLELTTGTSRFLYELLLDNQLDVAFIADSPMDNHIEGIHVFDEKLVFIAHYGHEPIREPCDLTGTTLLAFNEGCAYRNRLINWFRAYELKPERIANMASYYAILGGASAGMGVGIVPASVLTLFPQKETLSVYPMNHHLGEAITELVWRKNMVSANIFALRQFLSNREIIPN